MKCIYIWSSYQHNNNVSMSTLFPHTMHTYTINRLQTVFFSLQLYLVCVLFFPLWPSLINSLLGQIIQDFCFKCFVEQHYIFLYIYMNLKRNLHHKSTSTMCVSSKNDILTFHPPPNSQRISNMVCCYTSHNMQWKNSILANIAPIILSLSLFFCTCGRERTAT